MPITTLQQLEGRINAMRELLLLLASGLPADDRDALMAKLGELADLQNHQEDPGAIPSEAFAIEVACTREVGALLRDIEVRCRS